MMLTMLYDDDDNNRDDNDEYECLYDGAHADYIDANDDAGNDEDCFLNRENNKSITR